MITNTAPGTAIAPASKFYAIIYKKAWMKKRFHAVLKGNNNETTWTSQRVHNKKDMVDLLTSWFPGIVIKNKTAAPPKPRLVKS